MGLYIDPSLVKGFFVILELLENSDPSAKCSDVALFRTKLCDGQKEG